MTCCASLTHFSRHLVDMTLRRAVIPPILVPSLSALPAFLFNSISQVNCSKNACAGSIILPILTNLARMIGFSISLCPNVSLVHACLHASSAQILLSRIADVAILFLSALKFDMMTSKPLFSLCSKFSRGTMTSSKVMNVLPDAPTPELCIWRVVTPGAFKGMMRSETPAAPAPPVRTAAVT